jgi:hypothetical protein
MTRRRGLLLLALQTALLLSLAGRLLLDRALRPRGWARTAPIDPELPIRGRYLSVVLQVPVQGLRAGQPWPDTLRLVPRGDRVVGEPVAPGKPGQGPRMAATRLPDGEAQLFPPLAFFLPEHGKDPSRRAAGEELWAEVSLPEQGEPRPIRLGVRRAGQRDPLPLPLR